MEVLNNIITNLTEEKENNAIKISSLLHENEKLKQNITNNSQKENENDKINGKKYEEIIIKLKKNMLSLKEENKALEEVIIKQESEVSQLSSKVIEAEKVLIQKDLYTKEQVDEETGRNKAKEINAIFKLTSAKNERGAINDYIKELLENYLKKHGEVIKKEKSIDVSIESFSREKTNTCC